VSPIIDPATDPAIDKVRAQFPAAETSIYFDHAAVGPISIAVSDAITAVTHQHLTRGFQKTWRADIERVRGQVAALVGGHVDGVAFVQNTSFGISLAANGIDWADGDNIVLPQHEFPSNCYPWMNLAHRGVELRRVPAASGHADIDDIAAAIDGRTRAVSISYVQYSSGYRYDLAAIGELCHERDVLFVVDGTQAIGALAIDVQQCGVDLLAVSSHKWMLGPHGIGFAVCSDMALDRLRTDIVGWLTVREPFNFDDRLDLPTTAARFEPGTENLLGTFGLGGSIDLIERFGVGWIEQRVLTLTDHLCDALPRAGCRVISDRTAGNRSGIVVFAHHDVPNDVLHQRLTDAGVRCSVRGGGIRFSPHCYNTVDEIDAALAVIDRHT
jgi:cysteine desulfurase/selenocysteine lyase